jgi:hypothetical protein
VKAQFTFNYNSRAIALSLLRDQRFKCNRRKALAACNRNCRSIDSACKRHLMCKFRSVRNHHLMRWRKINVRIKCDRQYECSSLCKRDCAKPTPDHI